MADKKKSFQQALTLLEDNETLYRLLVNSVKDYAIFMLDPNGIISSWNLGAQRIKGYSAEEIIGQHFSVFYPLVDQQAAFPQYELEVATKEGRFEHEGWRIRKDGSRFWANVIITATYDSTGRLVGFSKVTRDLTDRKQLEEELMQSNQSLKESQMRYRLLIEGVQDYAILMLDPNGIVTTWNVGAQRIKGYSAEEIIGQHFSVFYPPQAVQEGFPAYELQQTLLKGRFEDEGWRIRKDGSRFWANVIITALYDEQHIHRGFAKITRDMSQWLRNEELTKKNQELMRINTDLDNFVYTASHDLKAPIANLEGLLAVLQGKIKDRLTDSELPLLAMLQGSVRKLQDTIGGLIEITKAQRDSQEAEVVPVREVIQEVVADLHAVATEAKAGLQLELGVSHLRFARPHLRSIIYNLLSNAIKYRSPERVAQIHLSTDQEEDGTVLKVEDNGLGMSAVQLSKLFTMFKRFHPQVEGTGVGLYIVKRTIENHGGRITVESQPGKGTIFRVYFPA